MVIFQASFDNYAASQVGTEFPLHSGAAPTFGSPGRNGYGNYASISNASGNDWIGRAFGTTYTTLTGGIANFFTTNVSGAAGGMGFYDAGMNLLCFACCDASGQFRLAVPGNPDAVQSASGILVANTWQYLECQVLVSNTTTGSVTLRVNGVVVATATGVKTAANGNPISAMAWGNGQSGSGNGSTVLMDDIYVTNNSSPNAGFLGNVKAVVTMPNGVGRVSNWQRQPAGPPNYTAVNEIPPDADTTYVFASAPATNDAYALQTPGSVTPVTTIISVKEFAYARGSDTPAKVLGLGVGNGASEVYDAGHALNNSYAYALRFMDQNPLTSAPWLSSDWATLQAAIIVIS